MKDLIRKRDIDYISAPIAPVLKGEKVHYEYVAFRKQIEDISPVPAIPISVIEQIKAEIKTAARKHLDIALSITDLTERKEHLKAEEALNYCVSLIDRHIKEYTE